MYLFIFPGHRRREPTPPASSIAIEKECSRMVQPESQEDVFQNIPDGPSDSLDDDKSDREDDIFDFDNSQEHLSTKSTNSYFT